MICIDLVKEGSLPSLKKSIEDFKASGVVQRLLFLAASLLSTVFHNGDNPFTKLDFSIIQVIFDNINALFLQLF